MTALPFTDTADAPIRPGVPTLIVRDLAAVARYYEDMIGLHRIDAEPDTVRLGAGGRVLLVLRKRDVDQEKHGFAGLFHTAFLMPSRPELGRWLHRAIKADVAFDGASDHLVSEALYLSDPEGNGIEVYCDRPRAEWRWSDNRVGMATDPLDVQGLVASGGAIDASAPARVPDGMTVGHIHLRVGGLPEAERFYSGLLGLDVTASRQGAIFYSSGKYHHHVATNVWQSRNSPKRSGTTTGLASFELLAKDQAVFDAAAERLLAHGAKRDGDAIVASDPWENRVILKRV